MPGGDRSRPLGAGPKTGRGLGYCIGNRQPGYASPAPGFRDGSGKRRGWRQCQYTTPAPEEEIAVLKEQADLLKTQLDAIQKRIEALSS